MRPLPSQKQRQRDFSLLYLILTNPSLNTIFFRAPKRPFTDTMLDIEDDQIAAAAYSYGGIQRSTDRGFPSSDDLITGHRHRFGKDS